MSPTWKADLRAWAEEFADVGHVQAQQVLALFAENERLRRGDFTPEEFQGLCHHRDERPGCTAAEFEAGCREYQRKLFGPPAGAAIISYQI